MKAAVVILNWNTGQHLRAFLPSLVASCPEGCEVIVADNASCDTSLDYVSSAFPGLKIIRLDDNYGFTGGYNRALDGLDADYYVLINSDVDTAPGWLEPLLAWMDGHPECGVCGPLLHALEADGDGRFRRSSRFEYAGAAGGLLDRFCYPFCRGRVPGRTEEDRGQYGSPSAVMWVSGACLVTRASVWRELGGLDERFFAHMEEIDYCWRAQLSGWQVSVVPDSVVWHLGGGTLPQGSPLKLRLNYRNCLLMMKKNLPATVGRTRAAVLIFTRKLLDGASALVYLASGRMDWFKAVLQAHMEERELSKGPSSPPVSTRKEDAVVHGYWKICIILQGLLRGGGIFKHLREYENRH